MYIDKQNFLAIPPGHEEKESYENSLSAPRSQGADNQLAVVPATDSGLYFKDRKLYYQDSKINDFVEKHSFYVMAQILEEPEDGSFCLSWEDGKKVFIENFFSISNKKQKITYYMTHKINGIASGYFMKLTEHSKILGENNEIKEKKICDFLIADPSDPRDQFRIGKCLGYLEGCRGIAVEYYKKAADLGHLKAQDCLAEYYYYGLGVDQDHKFAFDLFKKSADAGCSSAQFHLYDCYFNGNGTVKNEVLALQYCEKAAENGCRKAQFQLGNHYSATDFHKAVDWFAQAGLSKVGRELIKNHPVSLDELESSFDGAELPSAIFSLALCFEKGKGVEKNKQLAFILYSKVSKLGFYEAHYRLGCCYKKGIGIEQDYKKAFEYFKKSTDLECADKGFLDPLYDLANMYEEGLGVKKNLKKALSLYMVAAEKGLNIAQHKLGDSYKNGALGLEINDHEAIHWYERAVEKKFVPSMIYLADILVRLNKKDRRKKNPNLDKKAFNLFKEVADMGFVVGKVRLMNCFINGIGVLQDIEKAKKYAELVASVGNPEGMSFLGVYYLPNDPKKAMNYFLIAAEKNYSPAMEQLSTIYRTGMSGIEKNIELSTYWGEKARNDPECFWEDPTKTTDNVLLQFSLKLDVNEDLKFWLNSVLFLCQKYNRSANELDVLEIEGYAKELKNLHEKMQDELDQKCKEIQDEYYKNVTLKEILSEFNTADKKIKDNKQQALTPAKKSTNASKNKKNKTKNKAKSNTKKNTSQTKANVFSAKKNCQTVKKSSESNNSIIKMLEKLNNKKSSPYEVLPRVTKRWASTNLEDLRNLTDVVDGQIIKRYELLSNKALLEQRALHYHPDLEKILSISELKGIFAFSVEDGVKVFAQINFGNGKPSKMGMISFGVGNNKNSGKKDVLYHRYMNLEEGVNLKTLFNPVQGDAQIREEEEGGWINVSETTFDICPEGLKVSFKGETHVLTIFPTNYKAWYDLWRSF